MKKPLPDPWTPAQNRCLVPPLEAQVLWEAVVPTQALRKVWFCFKFFSPSFIEIYLTQSTI